MKTIHGHLIVVKDFKQLINISGAIYIDKGATLTIPNLVEVSESLCVDENANFTVPKLKKSHGIFVRENATLIAPELEHSASIHMKENSTLVVPKLKQLDHFIYVDKNVSLTAPNLVIKNNVANINNKEYGIITPYSVTYFIDSKKTSKGITIYSVFNFYIKEGNIKFIKGFLVEKKGVYTHGETLKEALV